MSKRIVVMGLLAGIMGLAGCSNEEKTFKLRLGHSTATDFPYHIAAVEFCERVKEGTDGNVIVNIFPNAQLGNEQVMADSLVFGTLDFALINQAYASSYVQPFGFLSTSYLFENEQHVNDVVLDPDYLAIMKAYVNEKQPGFEFLGTIPSGVRSVYSTVPLRSLDDFRGFKIRIMPSKIETMVWKALGTQSVSVPLGEVYSALQTELAKGAENTPSLYNTAKHFEVAPYYIKTEHQFLTVNLFASQSIMKKLPEEYIQVIQDAAVAACRKGSVFAEASDAKTLEQLSSDSGVTVIEVDKAPFMEAVKPLHATIAEDLGAQRLMEFIATKTP